MSKETYYSPEIEYQASSTLESYHIPDFYCYFSKDGKLYSPVTGLPVEDSITERDELERMEKKGFSKIQDWFNTTEDGMIVWISPPHLARPCGDAKIVFSDIVYEWGSGKQLRNRSVDLDWNLAMCQAFAKRLGSPDIFSEEKLRTTPFSPKFATPDEFISILKEYDQKQAKIIETGEDILIKENLKARLAAGYYVAAGPYPGSCGPSIQSAFNVMYGNSLNIGEKWSYHDGTCRICGEKTFVGPCDICKVCEKKF